MSRGRSRNLQSRNRAMLGLVGSLVVALGLIAAGLYFYTRNYGDTSAAYDRTIADCVRDRTRVSADTQDQATSDCVRDTSPDAGNQ